VGSEAIKKAYRKAHKPLKADEILAQRSVIPAISTHKRPSGTTDGVIEPKQKKQKSTYISLADQARLRKRAYGGDNVPKEFEIDLQPNADPWADKSVDDTEQNFPFLDLKNPLRAPKTLKEAPRSLLASRKALPHVLKPKGAHSYNPTFEEWTAELQAEGEKEVLAEQARLKAAAEEAAQEARIAKVMTEPEKDPLLEEHSEWEGIESEFEEDPESLKKKRPERKTPAQRNKVKRRKKEEAEKRHNAHLQKREQQTKQALDVLMEVGIKSIDEDATDKALVAEVEEKEEEEEEEIDDNQLRKKRYAKYAIPEKNLELVLPDELQDSLRALKPEGNLLRDRFRNMMVSGRIEPRPKRAAQQKKAKRTYSEKWTYKDFTVTA
jgi:nucleolar protein 53